MDDEDNGTLMKMKRLFLPSSKTIITETATTDFDRAVGHIEDLLIDDQFYNLQRSFLERHWPDFEDSEENKHEHMEIFFRYTNAVEAHIATHLQKKIPGFSMGNFIADLVSRKNELDGEVFEVLFTLTDFTVFKEMFLDYRKMKMAGELDLSSAISIQPIRRP